MNIHGKPYRTIWLDDDNDKLVKIIDQTLLPHQFVIRDIRSWEEMATAIRDMWLRGAGLIGAAAAYGIYLASLKAVESRSPIQYLTHVAHQLEQTRPTAVNLQAATTRMLDYLSQQQQNLVKEAKKMAEDIANDDVSNCKTIGEHGLKIIQRLSQKKNGVTLNILTHCNAGWLAFVDYGSALAPVYLAHNLGIKVHVWVDETRPRNQGARLTAWELAEHGVPHTIIADNTGGHLMQIQQVDMVIVGSDRCTRNGDVANKIGTYLKALAAKDNHIPFYVALPSSTIDWEMNDGLSQIPIEERDTSEVKYMTGKNFQGEIEEILITPLDSPAKNYGFDITPARLISGIITERGVCDANETALLKLFPENKTA